MFQNILYIEQGTQSCHQNLYADGLRRQQKQQREEYEKKRQALLDELAIKENHNTAKPSKDFYKYSVQWKDRVNQKAILNNTTIQLSPQKRIVSKLPHNYVDPVNGWKEHANNYIQVRTTKSMSINAQPTINEQSKQIVYNEKIEDRLLRCGLEREQKVQYAQQYEKFQTEVQNTQKQTRPNEQVFERLYNYEKKPVVVEQYSLQLNRLPEDMEERVNKRRETYKLFEPRGKSQTPEKEQDERTLSKNEFLTFLQRNLTKKEAPESEEEEEQFPFKPELNKKSLILAAQKGESMIERQKAEEERKRQEIFQLKAPQEIHVNKSKKSKSNYSLSNILQKPLFE